MIEIKEVKTKKQLKEFALYPQKLYKGCPYYVPSFVSDEMSIMDEKKNASLENCTVKCFLAYKDGKVVGRIAGIIQHKYNEIQNAKNVRFSRFECINDKEVAHALLNAVEQFGKENGMECMHGPWGFNDQDREGLQTFGFDRRSTYATNYNYDYFPELVTSYEGMQDECEWVEYLFKDLTPDPRIVRLAENIKKRGGYTEVADSMPIGKIVKKYGKEVFDVINECYKVLDGYVPVEGAILDNVLGQFGMIINPEYLSVITNKEGKVVACGVALPSICEAIQKSKGRLFPFGFIKLLHDIKKPKELELAIIAVLPEYRTKGLNALVISRIATNIVKNGVTHVESNPELVTNSAVQGQWKDMDREIIKRRKCYKKSI